MQKPMMSFQTSQKPAQRVLPVIIALTLLNLLALKATLRITKAKQRSLVYTENATKTITQESICTRRIKTPPLQRSKGQLPKMLQEYVEMHAREKNCLQTGSNPACSQMPKTLIWQRRPIKKCCGIGDRLETILFVFAIAVLTKRIFIIDYKDRYTTYPLELTLPPSQIDWRKPDNWHPQARQSYERLNWAQGSLAPRFDGTNVTRPGTKRKATFNLFEDDFISLMQARTSISLYARIRIWKLENVLQNPYVQRAYPDLRAFSTGSEVNGLIRILYQMLFRMSPEIRQRMAEFKPPRARPYVGVHVRTGRDVNETITRLQWSTRLTDTQIANRVLKGVEEWRPWACPYVFVASDSVEIATEIVRVGSARGLIVTSIMRPAVHVSHTAVADASSTEGVAVCQAYLDVFTDLGMLAGASVLITTTSRFANPSRFSNSAFYLGDSDRMRVLYMD